MGKIISYFIQLIIIAHITPVLKSTVTLYCNNRITRSYQNTMSNANNCNCNNNNNNIVPPPNKIFGNEVTLLLIILIHIFVFPRHYA